jgi:hypothetical protein
MTYLSEKLGLSVKYDWSNSNITEDALIIAVLERCVLRDITICCMVFGLSRVNKLLDQLEDDMSIAISGRYLSIIQEIENERLKN